YCLISFVVCHLFSVGKHSHTCHSERSLFKNQNDLCKTNHVKNLCCYLNRCFTSFCSPKKVGNKISFSMTNHNGYSIADEVLFTALLVSWFAHLFSVGKCLFEPLINQCLFYYLLTCQY